MDMNDRTSSNTIKGVVLGLAISLVLWAVIGAIWVAAR